MSKAVCFLLSDWARGITGEILHVDGGYHAIGAEKAEVAVAREAEVEGLADPDGDDQQ